MRCKPKTRSCLALLVTTTASLAIAPGSFAADLRVGPFAGVAGESGRSGDGGPAVEALLAGPADVAAAPDGRVLLADRGNRAVRQVGLDGRITELAGPRTATDLDPDASSDGSLAGPAAVAFSSSGGVLIADAGLDVVQLLEGGRLRVVAGTGPGFGALGDGGPAKRADLASPSDVLAMPDGGFLIVDQGHQRLRRVWPDGSITTFAGAGSRGFAGDGGPATKAALNLPQSVALMPDGSVLVADTGNNRVRAVAPDGTIRTVAGSGAPGFGGDGGLATAAALSRPTAVSPFAGGFLVADSGNHRIRLVDSAGVITTWAGSGRPVSDGDGGVALAASFAAPGALAVLPNGRVLVADQSVSTVRVLGNDLAPVAAPHLRLQLAPLPRRLRHGLGSTLRFRVSGPARVTATVRARGGRRLTIGATSARGGSGALRITRAVRRRTRRMGPVVLRVQAVGSDGAAVESKVRVTLG